MAASALNRVKGMPFNWSVNPYRGCVHGCHYCYARSTHAYLDLNVGTDFTGELFAKVNLPTVLASELARPGWRRELVAMGTATDVYQPIEGQFRLTRALLAVFARYRTPVSIVTKGPLIVRDIDVLTDLAAVAEVIVCFSVGTVDESIWRRTEPGTAPPLQRLRALARLRAAGLNAGVLMAPLLPGLSAEPHQIARVVAAAADHGAAFVTGHALRLGPLVREHYFGMLAASYPHLVVDLDRLYRQTNAPHPVRAAISAAVDGARRTYGVSGQTAFLAEIRRPELPRTLPLPTPHDRPVGAPFVHEARAHAVPISPTRQLAFKL
jgi:DNA repair photolyase